MSREHCRCEDELLEALGRGYVNAELEAHLASCKSCAELQLVAGALLEDRAAAMIGAPIPSSAAMWWRMQLRQQQEAAAAARRSLLIGHAATLLVAIVLVVAFFGTDVAAEARKLVVAIRLSTPLLITFATWMVLAPVAGWMAVRGRS